MVFMSKQDFCNSSKNNLEDDFSAENYCFLRSIYDNLLIGVEFYDSKGVLRHLNDVALNHYGIKYNASSVIGKINIFENPHMNATLKERILSGDKVEMDFEYDFDLIKNTIIF